MKKRDISSTDSFDHLPPLEHHASHLHQKKQALFTNKGSSTSFSQLETPPIKDQHLSNSSCSSFTHHTNHHDHFKESFSHSIDTTSETVPVSSNRSRILAAKDFSEMGMRKIDSDEELLSAQRTSNSSSGKTTLPSLSLSSRESSFDSEGSPFAESASLSSFSTGGFAITQQDLKAVEKALEATHQHDHASRGTVKKLRNMFLKCVEVDSSISQTRNFSKKKEKISKALEKILLKKVEKQKELNTNPSSEGVLKMNKIPAVPGTRSLSPASRIRDTRGGEHRSDAVTPLPGRASARVPSGSPKGASRAGESESIRDFKLFQDTLSVLPPIKQGISR